MPKSSFYIVNALTIYRLLASLVLLYFVIRREMEPFRWLLAISFLTDALDGNLARRYHVTSARGARYDSIADDLTTVMALAGIFVFKPGFIQHERVLVILLTVFYLAQTLLALFRYGKISSFHTLLAKGATIFQGVFFLLLFFLPDWPLAFFRVAAFITLLDLLEEIILVLLISDWKANVKGLYWVIKSARHQA